MELGSRPTFNGTRPMMEGLDSPVVEDVIGVDFGASRVTAVLAEMVRGRHTHGGRIQVRDGNLRSAEWLQGEGSAVHRASLHACLDRLLEGLRMAAGGRSLRRAWAGLPSGGIETRPLRSRVQLRSGLVTERDAAGLLKGLRKGASDGAGPGRFLLHLLPTRWMLDGRSSVSPPVGQRGRQLDLRALAIYAPVIVREEVVEGLSMKGLSCEGMVLGSLAAGHALLTPEQRRRGVALIDVGSDTTDVGIWACDRPIHFATLQEGGRSITRELAGALSLSLEEAERLKCDCMQSARMSSSGQVLPGMSLNLHRGARHQLAATTVLGFHLDLLRSARELLLHSGLQVWEREVVLCGGAMSSPAVLEQAQGLFGNVPVTQRQTSLDEGIRSDLRTHRLAAAVGLLELARHPVGGDLLLDPRKTTSFGRLRSRVLAFVDEYF